MKTKIAQRLSLRCKFKDENTVELTVVDHETCETTQILWNFRATNVTVVSKSDEEEKGVSE